MQLIHLEFNKTGPARNFSKADDEDLGLIRKSYMPVLGNSALK